MDILLIVVLNSPTEVLIPLQGRVWWGRGSSPKQFKVPTSDKQLEVSTSELLGSQWTEIKINLFLKQVSPVGWMMCCGPQKWINGSWMSLCLWMGVGLHAIYRWLFPLTKKLMVTMSFKDFPGFSCLKESCLQNSAAFSKLVLREGRLWPWWQWGSPLWRAHHMRTKCVQTGVQICKTGTVFWKIRSGSVGV